MDIAVARQIDAPADRVWSIITDIEHSAEVISAIRHIERLDPGNSFGVGTRWRETRVMFGKEATEEMAVTALELGRGYTVEADSRGTHYRSVLHVEPVVDGRSRLTMTFAAVTSGTVAKLMAATVGRLFEGATRKALRRDLDDIAAAAEAKPAG